MFLVPLLLLASTLHAGPERATTPTVPDASPYSQLVADVVAGDDAALVVWHEPSSIYAARIDGDGRRLDASPIVLTRSQCGSRPAMARGGGRWAVMSCLDWNIVAQFVEDDGSVSAPVPLAPWPHQALSVAFDGTNYLVAWAGMAMIVDADGGTVKEPFVVDADPSAANTSVVALDSGFAMLTLRVSNETGHVVNAFRISTAGEVTGHRWLDQTNAYVDQLEATADGDRVIALWRSIVFNGGVFGPAADIFLAREEQPLRVVAAGPLQTRQVFEANGTFYALVVDESARTVHVISEDGSRRTSWQVAGELGNVRAAAVGGKIIVALSSTSPTTGEHDLWTTVLEPSLQPEVALQRLAYDEPALQTQPAIARDAAGNAVIVWNEQRAIRMMSVDHEGRRLQRFVLLLGDATPATRPRIASDGQDFLVAWDQGLSILRRDGTLTLVAGSIGGTTGCLTWNGSEYVAGIIQIVAPGSHGHVPTWQVRELRVSPDGTLTSNRPISAVGDIRSADCMAGDSASLFAWTRGNTIEGAIVTDGATIGSTLPIATAHTPPAVAANGDRFVVAWTSDAGTIDRAAVSVHGTVTPVSDVPMITAAPDPTIEEVALAPFRDGFMLAWGRYDLRALALDADGRAMSTQFDLAVTEPIEREVGLAGGDSLLAVYMRDLNPPSLAPRWRVFTRTVTTGEPHRRAVRH
jgi:hypothetical protein